jgi:hypothetical protein
MGTSRRDASGRDQADGLASGLISGLSSGLISGDVAGAFTDGAAEPPVVLLLQAPTNSAAARIKRESYDFMGGVLLGDG